MARQKVSVILTVLNEVGLIDQTIQSLLHQTQKPAEIVVVDGGSTDGTWEYLKNLQKIRSYQISSNRSVGRNVAISKARYPIIAITDVGCIPKSDWLEKLTQPFSDKTVEVVSGFYQGVSKNIFEKSQIPYVLVMPDRADKTEFFPATRSMAIRKSVFEKTGGFNPELNYSEDFELAHRLKKMGVHVVFAKGAVVGWAPRKSLKEAFWMFLFFAIGDIKAGIIRPNVRLLFIRYFVFFFVLFLIMEISPLFIIPYSIFCLIVYGSWATLKNYRYVRDLRAFFWLPVLQLTADISVLFGSLIGLLSKKWVTPALQQKA